MPVLSRLRGALALVGALSLTLAIVWASRGARSKPSASSSPAADAAAIAAGKERSALPAVSTLARQEASAYQARLFADEEGAVLVTPTGFGRLRNDEAWAPRAMDLGAVVARQGASLVFWRAGWLREVSLEGGADVPLAAVARAPQHLLASEQRVAWVDVEPRAGASLHTMAGGTVRIVHELADRVYAAALRGAVVYWILQSPDASWRIGRMHLDEQRQTLTAARQGRPPALLAVGPDGVYFYDGPERGVRRLSFDLEREEPVAPRVICSPLVVSSRAICAQVGGLFDVPRGGTAPRLLALEREGPITALAATDERVFWVAESGNDRLVLRTALLAGP